jgi:hypothetical protein
MSDLQAISQPGGDAVCRCGRSDSVAPTPPLDNADRPIKLAPRGHDGEWHQRRR